MKIFNWVQRRFHHNVLKDGLVRNVRKTDSIAIDTNTKALLEQVALVDVLDGWRDGILTIGTFGFDPLKSISEPKDYLGLKSHDDEEEEEAEEERYSGNNDDDDEEEEEEEDDDDDYDDNNSDEEVNPLMFSTFDHSFEDLETNVGHAKHGKPDVTVTVDGVAGSTDHEIKFDLDVTEGHSGKLRRRTTLADLFSEDSDMKKKPSLLELESNSGKKASLPAKKGLSFAKKLIPQVGEDSRPIKMLHQMMRRMLKRKIHPELEGKSNKLDGQCKASVIDVFASKKHEAGESVSLLQSQDAATA